MAGTSASKPVRARRTGRPCAAADEDELLLPACVPAEPLPLDGVAGVLLPDPCELPPPWLWWDDPLFPLFPPVEPEPPWSGSEYWSSPALCAIAAVGIASASEAKTISSTNGRRGDTSSQP